MKGRQLQVIEEFKKCKIDDDQRYKLLEEEND